MREVDTQQFTVRTWRRKEREKITQRRREHRDSREGWKELAIGHGGKGDGLRE
jgi:hypothetical protein